MYKIAVLGNDNSENILSLQKYFKDKGVDFICISNNENSTLFKNAKKLNISFETIKIEDLEEYFKNNFFNLIVLSDFQEKLSSETISQGIFLNIHDSLLPKYKVENPVKEAFEQKEKMTGVSVYLIQNSENLIIISQQAVEITENLSLEDLKQKIKTTENYLYPKVIEDLLFTENIACQKEGCCSSSCGSSNCNCNGCS